MKELSRDNKQKRKAILIIAVVLLVAVLSFVAFRFLFTQKDLVKYSDPLPDTTTAGKMYIDQIRLSTEKEGKYQLSGWGFLTSEPELTPDDYNRKVFLSSGVESFTLATETMQRVDVQKAFVDLNMVLVNSGFSSELSLDKLPIGKYSISILFEKADKSKLLLNSIWILDRTENAIQLIRTK